VIAEAAAEPVEVAPLVFLALPKALWHASTLPSFLWLIPLFEKKTLKYYKIDESITCEARRGAESFSITEMENRLNQKIHKNEYFINI